MAQNKKRKKTPAQLPSASRKRALNKTYIDKAYAAIKKMLCVYGLEPELFDRLTKNQRSAFLLTEIQAPKFKVAEGYRVPRQLVAFLNSSTLHFVRENCYGDESIGLSYLELVTYGAMFYTQINSIHKNRSFPPEQMQIVDEIAAKFALLPLDQPLLAVGLHFRKIVQMISKVNFRIYGYDWTLSDISADGVLKSIVNLYSTECQSVYFTYRNKSHKAFRVMCGQVNTDPFYGATIDQWLITGKEIDKDETIDIYIQSHALQRIKERVDIFPAHKRNFYVMSPLLYLHEVVYGLKDRIMFECFYKDVLFGYYPFEVQGDKLFVLSFLPVISPDTPKGMLLVERLKLQKEDMIHLGMDKLSFFFTVDIGQIPALHEALLEVGLGPLLEYTSEDMLPFEYDEKKTLRVKNFFEKNKSVFEDKGRVATEINIKRNGVVNTVKRKRPDTLQEQKMQKVRRKNGFMDKLLAVCRTLGDESLYKLMPENLRFEMYIRRSVVKVKAAEGVRIRKRLFEVLNDTIGKRLQASSMELLAGSGRTVSMEDYINVVFTMEASLEKKFREEYFPGKERFDGFLAEIGRRRSEFDEMIYGLGLLNCTLFDDLSRKQLYSFTMGFETNLDMAQAILESSKKRHLTPHIMEELDFKMYHTVTIGVYPLKSLPVTVRGETFTVIELGLMTHEHYGKCLFQPVTVKGRELKRFCFNREFARSEIAVYVSENALERIVECSGHSNPGLCKMDLVSSFREPVVRRVNLNSFMIDFRLNNVKVGYLTASLRDGILAVTGFMLVTDRNAFEGYLLKKLLRRRKLGEEYSSIDSLAALARTDLLENEAVCKIFRDAGCQSVLDMCARLKEDDGSPWMIGLDKTTKINIKDLNLNPDDDEYIEG